MREKNIFYILFTSCYEENLSNDSFSNLTNWRHLSNYKIHEASGVLIKWLVISFDFYQYWFLCNWHPTYLQLIDIQMTCLKTIYRIPCLFLNNTCTWFVYVIIESYTKYNELINWTHWYMFSFYFYIIDFKLPILTLTLDSMNIILLVQSGNNLHVSDFFDSLERCR